MIDNNQTPSNKKNQLVVYTALFGDYDNLIDPAEKFEGCDFVCFTDQPDLESDIWEIRLIKECDLPPNMMNRRYKILPHLFFPEYERSLYIDANISMLKNPLKLIDVIKKDSKIIIAKHFKRSSIYDEAFVLIRSGRVSIKKVFKLTKKYLSEGYIEQKNMGENNVIYREHNKLLELSTLWWNVFETGPHRDQLSLGYVAWKTGESILLSEDLSARRNDFFSLHPHAKKNNHSIIMKTIRYFLFAIPYLAFVKYKKMLKK